VRTAEVEAEKGQGLVRPAQDTGGDQQSMSKEGM
jgi:hypothetical protein